MMQKGKAKYLFLNVNKKFLQGLIYEPILTIYSI